jgi:Leucine-rich repeat (LRR) protein
MLTTDAWITSAHTSQSDTDIAWQTYMLPVLTASALIGLSLATLLCSRVRQFFCPPPPLQWVAPSAVSPHWARQNQTHPKRIAEQVPALLEPEPTTPFNDPGMAQIIMRNIKLREVALNMSAVNKNLYDARFQSPALQHFRFKKAAHVNQFLAYCQHMQETIKCGALRRTQEAFYPVRQLSLILSDELTAEQCVPLFYYLPQIEQLTIAARIKVEAFANPHLIMMGPSVQILLTAAQSMSLQHLHIEGALGWVDDDMPDDFLPDTLWQLTTLKTLNLVDLNISGISEKIGNLQALKTLVLNRLFLQTLPEALWELKKLEHLDLTNLELSTLSEKMGHLPELTSLSLSSSPLTHLPESVWNLKKLKELRLYHLPLSALSEKIGNLQALTSLHLMIMPLLELPEAIWNLKKLENLSLDSLKLSALSEKIGNLPALISLRLDGIPLLALPANIWNLKKLEKLILQDLSLTRISEDIGHLQQLTELKVALREIQTFPENLWKLEKLEKLSLAHLSFVTALSEKIGNLQALTYLSLESMPLTTLPDRLWELENLTTLRLCGLEELVKIPEKIANLRNLTALRLSCLPKIFSLPEAVFTLTSLNRITIDSLGFPLNFKKGEYIW